MQASRNPAKARPLSPNVLRMMRQSRASQEGDNIICKSRHFTTKDLASCEKQGNLFMEAASMGFTMDDFAPTFMTSQLAGVFDVNFSSSAVLENNSLGEFLQIPILLKSPQLIVEALYWIDDIIAHSEEGANKSLLLTEAYNAEKLKLPAALAELPKEQNRDIDALSYAYWLGFIYRCECLLHDESSRMVYGAYPEDLMRTVYNKLMSGPTAELNLVDIAESICADLDRLLVEHIWPEEEKELRKRQAEEMARPKKAKASASHT